MNVARRSGVACWEGGFESGESEYGNGMDAGMADPPTRSTSSRPSCCTVCPVSVQSPNVKQKPQPLTHHTNNAHKPACATFSSRSAATSGFTGSHASRCHLSDLRRSSALSRQYTNRVNPPAVGIALQHDQAHKHSNNRRSHITCRGESGWFPGVTGS